MTYQAKDFTRLHGMEGFSDELLEDHFGLYKGYVSHTNELLDKLRTLAKRAPESAEFSELQRRLGWEFNGMRLHELYFSNLGGRDTARADELEKPLVQHFSDFGTVEAWADEFRTIGSMRGVGWAILYYDAVGERLMNVWVDEHATYHLTGCTPLLVMDVWEHAFAKDYGTDRQSYIDAFMKNIRWSEVSSRLALATPALAGAH